MDNWIKAKYIGMSSVLSYMHEYSIIEVRLNYGQTGFRVKGFEYKTKKCGCQQFRYFKKEEFRIK